MKYAEYTLTDLGFYVVALGGPGEIWGLDNMMVDDDDQRFRHLGYTGYPEGQVMLCERPDKTKCFAAFASTAPTGGTAILAANVVSLLVSDYGWPVGTTLVDGLPMLPAQGA